MNEKNNSLARIAAEMRSYAIDNPRLATTGDTGPYRRKLTGGLGLVLYLNAYHTWHLSMYRQRGMDAGFPLDVPHVLAIHKTCIRGIWDISPFFRSCDCSCITSGGVSIRIIKSLYGCCSTIRCPISTAILPIL